MIGYSTCLRRQARIVPTGIGRHETARDGKKRVWIMPARRMMRAHGAASRGDAHPRYGG